MSRRSKDKGVLKSVSAREEALVRTQLKIMDIGPPLIDLYSRLATLEEATASLSPGSPAAVGPCVRPHLQETP
jgi:hypothetical protein